MMDATGEDDDMDWEDDDSLSTFEKCPQKQNSCTAPSSKRTLNKLTNEQIVAEAVGLMMAGYDTTANALAYTCYLLALNPDIQERLQSEIDNYFNDKPVGN